MNWTEDRAPTVHTGGRLRKIRILQIKREDLV